MATFVVLLALLAGSAPPASAPSADEAKQRKAQSWEVLFNHYPPGALARKEQGLVGFKIGLDRDGYSTSCEVTHTSGSSRLDNETCELVLKHAEFKGIRGKDGRKISGTYEGVVNWRLPTTPMDEVPQVPVQVAKKDAPEKMICKRKLKTGSLADFERTCATASQWDRVAQHTREEWGELQGSKGATNEAMMSMNPQ